MSDKNYSTYWWYILWNNVCIIYGVWSVYCMCSCVLAAMVPAKCFDIFLRFFFVWGSILQSWSWYLQWYALCRNGPVVCKARYGHDVVNEYRNLESTQRLLDTSASGLLGGSLSRDTSHPCPRASSVNEIASSPRVYYAKINVACPFVHDRSILLTIGLSCPLFFVNSACLSIINICII